MRSAQFSRPIYLIFDDPYRYLYYGDEPLPEPAQFYDQVLYIGSFSKDLGLAGERIGYVAIHPGAAGREDLQRAFPFVMRALGHVNAPALLQRAAAELIDLPRDEVCEFYRRRRDRVITALDEAGLEYPPLEGAFYAYPDVSSFGVTVTKFLEELASKEGVLVGNGENHGGVSVLGEKSVAYGHIRPALVQDLDALEEAVNRIERFTKTL